MSSKPPWRPPRPPATPRLHALTQRLTAEFALRPFIVAHPELSFAMLARWCRDDSAHVRRLTSVHNGVQAHLPGAPAERAALPRHASRTVVKQGHTRRLRVWGLGTPLRGQATLKLEPASLHVGESFIFTPALASSARHAQTLAVDYAVHHVKADGHTSPKVFRGWQVLAVVTLPPRGWLTLVKRHSIRVITTRRYHPGRHSLSVQANGREVARADFELQTG